MRARRRGACAHVRARRRGADGGGVAGRRGRAARAQGGAGRPADDALRPQGARLPRPQKGPSSSSLRVFASSSACACARAGQRRCARLPSAPRGPHARAVNVDSVYNHFIDANLFIIQFEQHFVACHGDAALDRLAEIELL